MQLQAFNAGNEFEINRCYILVLNVFLSVSIVSNEIQMCVTKVFLFPHFVILLLSICGPPFCFVRVVFVISQNNKKVHRRPTIFV